MNTDTIVITGVETKEGTSQAGKPWRLFKVVAQSGQKYSTFDGGLGQIAAGNIGKTATIGYETTDRGHDLKTLTVTGETPAPEPVAAPPAKTANGDTDWDLIGLRKTRCALWAALLSNGSFDKDIPAPTQAAFARELVIAAEQDIFTRPVGGGDLDDIPFARTFA